VAGPFEVLEGDELEEVLASADGALEGLAEAMATLEASAGVVAVETLTEDLAALGARTRLVGGGVGTSAVVNTVVETDLVSTSTPLGLVAGDVLVLRVRGTVLNASAGPVTFLPRVRLAGVAVVAGAAVAQPVNVLPSEWDLEVRIRVNTMLEQVISARGCQGAPALPGALGATVPGGPFDGVARSSGTANLATAKTLRVTVQMGTASPAASCALTAWELVLLRSPTS